MGSQHRSFESNSTYVYAKDQVRRVAVDLGTFTLVEVRRSIPQCNSAYIERAMRELREEGFIEFSSRRNRTQGHPRLYTLGEGVSP